MHFSHINIYKKPLKYKFGINQYISKLLKVDAKLKFLYLLLPIFLINNTIALTNSTELDRQVTNKINKLMHTYNIPGASVVIYKEGQIYKYNFGITDTKNRLPVTYNTIFELGSITKSFSGLLLALKVNNNEIDFNDKLADYLEDTIKISDSIDQITLLELATHTSGLPYNMPNIPYTARSTAKNEQQFQQFLQSWKSTYAPGKYALYSNFGFAMLGQALSNYADKPLFEMMQENILQPLNMQNSYFTIITSQNHLYAQGYTAVNKPARSAEGGMFAGSWAMKSSANDMEKYLLAAIGDTGTPNNITTAMQTAQTGYFKYNNGTQLGLGWVIKPLAQNTQQELLKIIPLKPHKRIPIAVEKITIPQYTGNALIEKTGATNGFRAYIGFIPDRKIGVVILINKFIADPHAIEHIGREIILTQ